MCRYLHWWAKAIVGKAACALPQNKAMEPNALCTMYCSSHHAERKKPVSLNAPDEAVKKY